MRYVNKINNVMDNETLVCMRVTIIDNNGKPSVMNVPVLINENDSLTNGFSCMVDIIDCDDSTIESEEDLDFGTKCNYDEIIKDIEEEFEGCIDSFHNDILIVRGKCRLEPVDMKWRIDFTTNLCKLAKDLNAEPDEDGNRPNSKENIDKILNETIPNLVDKFNRHFESSHKFVDGESYKIHLIVGEILEMLSDVESMFWQLRSVI